VRSLFPPSSAAAFKLSIAVAVILLAGGLADPSGIFTWIGFTGGPVAALWWWAPYVVYGPTLLALVFAGARWSEPAARAMASRRRRLAGFWAVTILATGAAELLYQLSVLLPMAWRGDYVVGWWPTWGFVAWSSGYAALKMALVGWLPALLAVATRRDAASPEPVVARRGAWTPGLLVAGSSALAVAVLGPWLATHWWQGSPLGYVYRADATLIAPTPASGAGHSVLALTLFSVALGWFASRRLVATRAGSARATFAAGAIAGVGAVAVLLLVQGVALFAQAGARAPDHDLWNLPALFARAVDAASFALIAGAIAGALAVVAGLLQRVARTRAEGRTDRWLLASGALAGVVALCLEGIGAMTAPAASLAPTAIATTKTTTAADAFAPLAVRADADGARIVDADGNRVTLRGFNINQLGEYFRRDPALPTVQPLAEQDFADIASLGMNVVRLTLSWSLLEPERGHVSQAYLDRIRQALGWARAHGVRVLLDIHQDAWSAHVDAPPGTRCRAGTDPMIGWDGAPAWATLTDGTPPCQVTGRDLAPNVSRAFQSFYVDREGVQARLVHDWQVLAREFGDDATVAGYDLLNEPNFGESPPLASTLLLANYYARAIQAIRAGEAQRAGGFHHIVLIEPSIIWSGFGIDNLPPRAFTPDTQIVFSPHLYNESITADQDFGITLVSVERGYALARAAAAQLGAPLWIGEWGYFRSSPLDNPLMQRSAGAEDMSPIGSTFWVWKQACSDPHVWPGHVAGNVRQLSCPALRDIGTATDLTRVLSRAYVRVSADGGARLQASGTSLSVAGRFEQVGRSGSCALQLWVPGDKPPQPAEVAGMSAPEIVRQAPGSATLGVSGGWIVSACLSGGDYRLTLR
jgi:hypothetical protein